MTLLRAMAGFTTLESEISSCALIHGMCTVHVVLRTFSAVATQVKTRNLACRKHRRRVVV